MNHLPFLLMTLLLVQGVSLERSLEEEDDHVITEDDDDPGMVYVRTRYGTTKASSGSVRPRLRNAVRDPFLKWPKGIVPYVFRENYPHGYSEVVLAGMREIENDTKSGDRYCVRFVPKTYERDFIIIYYVPHICRSTIGKAHLTATRKNRFVNLGLGCILGRVVVHELLHTLGFAHEQKRPDRDLHVDINWKNINSTKRYNFKKYSYQEMDLLGTPYDYSSIMHYPPYLFAQDKSIPTLVPKLDIDKHVQLGRSQHMSKNDIIRVQRRYHCPVDTTSIKTRVPVDYVIDCDFEDFTFCNLKQHPVRPELQFKIRSGRSPAPSEGPAADFTTSIGAYAYVSWNHLGNESTYLKTENISAGPYCLDVARYIGAPKDGYLHIILGDKNFVYGGNKYWSRWMFSFYKPATWSFAIGYLAPGNATIAFSDFAIDNVQLSKGFCPDRACRESSRISCG